MDQLSSIFSNPDSITVLIAVLTVLVAILCQLLLSRSYYINKAMSDYYFLNIRTNHFPISHKKETYLSINLVESVGLAIFCFVSFLLLELWWPSCKDLILHSDFKLLGICLLFFLISLYDLIYYPIYFIHRFCLKGDIQRGTYTKTECKELVRMLDSRTALEYSVGIALFLLLYIIIKIAYVTYSDKNIKIFIIISAVSIFVFFLAVLYLLYMTEYNRAKYQLIYKRLYSVISDGNSLYVILAQASGNQYLTAKAVVLPDSQEEMPAFKKNHKILRFIFPLLYPFPANIIVSELQQSTKTPLKLCIYLDQKKVIPAENTLVMDYNFVSIERFYHEKSQPNTINS